MLGCCATMVLPQLVTAPPVMLEPTLSKYLGEFKVKFGFPGSPAGKESTCNVGNTGLIPGSGRSSGEGLGYPLQYSQAFLVAQMVKNPPAMQDTWVRFLGWEDTLEKATETFSSILAWRIPWTEEPGGLQSIGSQRVRHD